jgi:ABC-type multidrug transport system fused ATPase/permease subunit
MANAEKEIQDAEIAKATETKKKIDAVNKRTRLSAFVKMLSMFVAVALLIYTIISGLQTSSFNLFGSVLSAVSFLIIIAILSLDIIFEWHKEREIVESTIRLDIHNGNILSLQGKYRELDRKYSELLKEQQKTNEYLQILKKEPKQKEQKDKPKSP